MKRVLFILKHRDGYTTWNNNHFKDSSTELSSGLVNSVKLLVEMMNDHLFGVEAAFKIVHDNNDIDREVTHFRPDIVIIEAFWVVPEKFDILKKLHPRIKWIVRNHSKSEFLANEGSAFGWLCGYLKKGIHVACNSKEAYRDFKYIARSLEESEHLVLYLPNYYHIDLNLIDKIEGYITSGIKKFHKHTLNVGCFGAIRPLKNHMNQAIATIQFSNETNLKVNFHINCSRVEGSGESILKNLRSLFSNEEKCNLVEHNWLPHDEFMELVSKMDIMLQVSLSETFNIVAADSVYMGVPIIGSKTISWLNSSKLICETDSESIKNTMLLINNNNPMKNEILLQRKCLHLYNKQSILDWKYFLERI